MQPSTHPPLPIVIFADERNAMAFARGLHFDAMQPDAGIGHGGAMHLESRLQAGWECEKLGYLPLLRRIPVGVEAHGVKCDDQHLAYQRCAVIYVPVRIRLGEGYGKLCVMRLDSRASRRILGCCLRLPYSRT